MRLPRSSKTRRMDSRFRGNDIRNVGNDRRKHSTPTLVLPPQGGGNIRIEIEITEKVDSRFRGNDRKTERK